MTETNASIHVLADETLGGIKREYVEVDRKAEVGEKIIVTSSDTFPEGFIAEVEHLDDFYEDNSFYLTKGIGGNFYLDSSDDLYRVLVPVETAEADEPQPADLIDVVSNLATRVADLERTIKRQKDEIDTLHKDNRTLGEELARLKESTSGVKGEKLFTADELAAIIERLLMRP
ncbi:hypothetical protein [Bacillus halotolerans]|uniref:hypothetical protein n=1 Tax=Bacillus halotolerans TaxID=260554 RepID=UPI00398AC45D